MNPETGEVQSSWSNGPLATGLMVLGALARLIPHPANFTPVGAMSLFAGARLRGWKAYGVPLLLMAVSDPLLSAIYGIPAFGRITVVIYGSFLINVWIGRRLRGPVNYRRLAAAAFCGSLQFFFLTNLAVWGLGAMYPHTIAGFTACFLAAIPFFGRTFAGDLLYAGLLFGLYSLVHRTVRNRKLALAKQAPAA